MSRLNPEPPIHPQIYADYTDEKIDSADSETLSVVILPFRTVSAVGRIRIFRYLRWRYSKSNFSKPNRAYVIRPLTKLDEPFLWEMLYQALYVPEGSPPFPREIVSEPEIAKYVCGWGRSGDLGFVLIDEASGLSVGAVWIRLFGFQDPGYGYVDDLIPELSIAMLPGYHNRGLGTQLLKHMLEEAAEQFSGLSLSVSSENPARRLYERLGFSIIEVDGSSLKMLLKFRHRETIVDRQ